MTQPPEWVEDTSPNLSLLPQTLLIPLPTPHYNPATLFHCTLYASFWSRLLQISHYPFPHAFLNLVPLEWSRHQYRTPTSSLWTANNTFPSVCVLKSKVYENGTFPIIPVLKSGDLPLAVNYHPILERYGWLAAHFDHLWSERTAWFHETPTYCCFKPFDLH